MRYTCNLLCKFNCEGDITEYDNLILNGYGYTCNGICAVYHKRTVGFEVITVIGYRRI